MQYPTTRGQEAPTMITTCEKCTVAPATHILHSGGPDPTDWHLCDPCDPDWRFHRNRSQLVEELEHEVENYDYLFYGEA